MVISMFTDPIVDDMQEYRQEHATQYDNDMKKIVAALQEKQIKFQTYTC